MTRLIETLLDPTESDHDTTAPVHDREVALIVARVQHDHPEVGCSTITELVERAFVELGSAKVQTFRVILAERMVRHRLSHEGPVP